MWGPILGCALALPLASGFGMSPSMGLGMRSTATAHRPLRGVGAPRMVATPLEAPTRSVTLPDYTGWTDLSQAPPFTLKDISESIPKHLWEKNTGKSLYYLAKDVAIVAALAAAAITLNNPLVWPLYWLAQGTMFWALFVVGHDCGHGSFSNSKPLNELVGHLTHASIMVPFHGWRISHRTHHANHGHVDNDESWYPVTKKSFDELTDPNGDVMAKIGAWVRFSFIGNLLAYPLYLWNRSPGRLAGSHYDWTFTREKTGDPDALFKDNEAGQVATSSASLVGMLALLTAVGAKFGLGFVLATWVAPYVVFVAWLDLVTYLHHTDKDMPWYRDPEWSYLRGGLTTTDRDYGILNGVHHDIGTHVVHHLFPQIPHYNLCEATEAVKPLMGPYYREPQASGFLPLHLIPKMIEGVKTCAYVKDEGSVVYYQDAAGKVSSIEQGAKKLYTPQEFA